MGSLFLEPAHVHILQGFVHPAPYFLRCYSQVFRPESNIVLNNGRDQLVIRILEYHAGSLSHIPDVFVVTGIVSVYIDYPLRRQQQTVQVLRQC